MRCLVVFIVSILLVCLLNEVFCENIIPATVENEKIGNNVGNSRILRRSTLQNAYESHLAMLVEAEQSLTKQIEELKQRREELSSRKRSHVMCLVNLISCFRKR